MGDWELTEFNARLVTQAFPKSSDYPRPNGPQRITPPGLRPLPALAPSASNDRPLWYHGPTALRPECMGNLEQYYREKPGAPLEQPLRILRGIAALACLATALLGLVLLTSNSAELARKSNPIPASYLNKIGIINPAWVESKGSRIGDAMENTGYFDSAGGLAPPPRYVYVTPAEAQKDLEELISLGFVTADGAPPDVVRDFEVLKKMGVTIDTVNASILNI